MRLTYINTYNDYDKLLKFQLLKVEKRKYIFVYLFTPITLITLYLWSKNQLNNIQLILLLFYMLVPTIIGLLSPKIFLLLNRKLFKTASKLYKLSDKKELSINTTKEQINYSQSPEEISIFKFDDIKYIIQNDDSIYILIKDKPSPIFTPIIPNSAFENEEAKKEFIELLSFLFFKIYGFKPFIRGKNTTVSLAPVNFHVKSHFHHIKFSYWNIKIQ